MIEGDDAADGTESNGTPGERYDRFPLEDDEPASVAVVRAVATVTGGDPMAIPPLQYAVDVDALDDLVRTGATASSADVRVSFSYEELTITVDSDLGVLVEAATEAAE